MLIKNCLLYHSFYNLQWYCIQNKISPNNRTLFNDVSRPKLLNIHFDSYYFINLEFLLPYIAHFDNNTVLQLLVFKTVGFMFSVFFCTLNNKMTYFKLLSIIVLRLTTSSIHIFYLLKSY